MISLELAKQLKDAGLKWDPGQGDWFEVIWEGGGSETWNTCDRLPNFDNPDETNVWYPGIIEILQAISAAGWSHDLRGGWTDISRDIYQTWRFPGEPEESAARALLHILKEGER
ncbi:MAG: hypothetical protein EWM48_06300 [Sphaerochaeta sp.]|jgi:hypothetical protein|nr:MAG: hypothetical protein EWM48_06300 [Sphaerochaeta sp.]